MALHEMCAAVCRVMVCNGDHLNIFGKFALGVVLRHIFRALAVRFDIFAVLLDKRKRAQIHNHVR